MIVRGCLGEGGAGWGASLRLRGARFFVGGRWAAGVSVLAWWDAGRFAQAGDMRA